eukprot:s4281_g1.t1
MGAAMALAASTGLLTASPLQVVTALAQQSKIRGEMETMCSAGFCTLLVFLASWTATVARKEMNGRLMGLWFCASFYLAVGFERVVTDVFFLPPILFCAFLLAYESNSHASIPCRLRCLITMTPSLVIMELLLLAMTFPHTVHAVRTALQEKDREVEPLPTRFNGQVLPEPKCPAGSEATTWVKYHGWLGGHWLYHSCDVCTKQAKDELPSCYRMKNPSATTYCRSFDGCECYVMKGESIMTCKPCEDANKDCSQTDPCAPPKNETATKKLQCGPTLSLGMRKALCSAKDNALSRVGQAEPGNGSFGLSDVLMQSWLPVSLGTAAALSLLVLASKCFRIARQMVPAPEPVRWCKVVLSM